jgi:hypothetical protein
MRFSAAITHPMLLGASAASKPTMDTAAEVLRKLLSPAQAQLSRSAMAVDGPRVEEQRHTPREADLPIDLDQRVRLIGEW